MKALILSASTGGGHNAAGRAVLEALRARKIEARMRDALLFSGKKSSRLVCNTYSKITTKAPALFGMVYRAGNFISTNKFKSVLYYANMPAAHRLAAYIEKNGFDTVLMLHLFPAETLTAARKNLGLCVKSYAIATDYTCIPFWEETEPDYFFIPHEDLKEEFISKGIPKEKLIATGIPVAQRFTVRQPKAAARKKLGLPDAGKLFLIMTGSMGYGNIEALISQLLELCGSSDSIVVLGGNNEALKSGLREKFYGLPVLILDYTNRVDEYMDACDLLFTKPGGLTSTEAAAKRIPLVHTAPIPGCENKNAEFFVSHGLSITGEDAKELARRAYALCEDDAALARMQAAQEREINRFAADAICDFILKEEQVHA